MGSLNRSRIPFSAAGGGPHQHPLPLFTRMHQICALALVVATFLLTRAFDRLSCPLSSPPPLSIGRSVESLFDRAGALSWPERGYGSRLDLKIYVYEEREVDGLRELMRGRDRNISPQACLKGQWGAQVYRQ